MADKDYILLYEKEKLKISILFNQPLENGTTYLFHVITKKDEKLMNIEIEPFEFYPKLIELVGLAQTEEIWKRIHPKIYEILGVSGNVIKFSQKGKGKKKLFVIKEFPKCALCDKAKELRISHIVPKFVAKWIKKTSIVGKLRNLENKRVQDSTKLYLLCEECEQKFSIFENYFADNIFHPTVNMKSKDVKYDINLLKFIVSVSWRILYLIISTMRNNLEEIPAHMEESESNWRDFLNDKAKLTKGSHYLLHSHFLSEYMSKFKKNWKNFTQRAVAYGHDNYNDIDFIWYQIPNYTILSPMEPESIYGYEESLIRDKGVFMKLCAINLEKFDFIVFIVSKIKSFYEEMKNIKKMKNSNKVK